MSRSQFRAIDRAFLSIIAFSGTLRTRCPRQRKLYIRVVDVGRGSLRHCPHARRDARLVYDNWTGPASLCRDAVPQNTRRLVKAPNAPALESVARASRRQRPQWPYSPTQKEAEITPVLVGICHCLSGHRRARRRASGRHSNL